MAGTYNDELSLTRRVMQEPGTPKEDPRAGTFLMAAGCSHFDADGEVHDPDRFSRRRVSSGATTYDIFAAHWPRVTDPGDLIAGKLNLLPKYVASLSRSTFLWHNTTGVRDVEKAVVELKQRYAREVQVHGSAGLAQTLIEKDFVDEYRLLTFPVVPGTGKRLFGNGAIPRTLKLVRSSTTSTGVTSAYTAAREL